MSGIDFNSRISYEPYHIYYDLTILNNDTTGTQRPPFLQFTEIRNSPYLMNPSDYFCSVVRFSLETPSLPVIIPQVQVGQNDPNLLVYSITLAHPTLEPNGIQKYLSFVPQSSVVLFPTPTTPITASALVNEYYYTFTYKPFIDMVNTALRSAWNDFITAHPIAGYTVANFPYLYWDEDANIATWVVPQELYETPTPNNPTPALNAALAAAPIQIFMNAPLFNLFSSFTAFQNGFGNAGGTTPTPTTFGRNWMMYFPNTVSTNPYLANTSTGAMSVLPQYAGKNCLRVSQEYPTTPLWNPVQSIVFTTSLLPIAPSIVSAPVLFGAGSSFTTSGNNSGISNILTDLEVPLEKGWQIKPSINYVPTAEYRLFDLNGNAPLSAIEISVNWKDTFGQVHQFRLASGCNSSLKLMFRRKDFQGVL
jgi:hypothetical protein